MKEGDFEFTIKGRYMKNNKYIVNHDGKIESQVMAQVCIDAARKSNNAFIFIWQCIKYYVGLWLRNE